MPPDDIFQRLYDLEINFAVSCFWDGGFEVALGDDMNGWRAEANVDTWAEVGPWLLDRLIEHFPEAAWKVVDGPVRNRWLLKRLDERFHAA